MAANVDFTPIIKAAVDDAVAKAAKLPSNSLETKDAAKVSTSIAKVVSAQVEPVIANQTNNEPWYKSRVLRGASAALVGLAIVVFQDWYADGIVTNEALGGYLVSAYGIIRVYYGRLTTGAPPVL